MLSVFYNNYERSITFKNCESLYCTPVTYENIVVHQLSFHKKEAFSMLMEWGKHSTN